MEKKLNKLKKQELIDYIKKLEEERQDLNLKFKYATFDSEACQREIEYLKKIINKKEKGPEE